MTAKFHAALLGAIALVLCGCYPEERIWWSPQGDQAIILIEGKLHLTDAAGGELGAPLVDDLPMENTLVRSVSWLADGSGFVCHRVRIIAGWGETRALIPTAEANAVEKLVPTVLPLLEAAVKMDPGAKTLEEAVLALPVTDRQRFSNAMRLAFQQDPVAIEQRLRTLPNGPQFVTSLQKAGAGYAVNELCMIKLENGRAGVAISLSRSLLSQALLPQVSPTRNAIAFLRPEEDGETAALEVLTLDGVARLTVARHVSHAFDWMPDGRSLVFMAPIGGKGEKLQSLHRVTVLQESGVLMKARHEKQPNGSLVERHGPDRLAEPTTLAMAITLNRPALQALSDGRVVFASQPVTLPVAGSGLEVEPRLFVVSADGMSIQAVPTARGDLPTNLAFFTVSPDGKSAAVVEGETDAVAVVDLDSGKAEIISPPHPHWQSRALPAWKSATELTFAALAGTAEKPAWMLWSKAGGMRTLSGKWPVEATAKWLEFKTPASAPEKTNATFTR